MSASGSNDKAALLRRMLLIRAFDETALELIWAKRIEGVVHPYIGQEGSATGVCSALREGDRVVSNHRGHGHCLAAGADPERMMAELFGRVDGYCRGRGGSMHIADFEIGMLGANGIVGAGVPMAVGTALADTLDGEGERLSVSFFGDGATGQGIIYESINFAVLWKLPVLFVCENNGFAANTPLAQTIPGDSVADLVAGHGLKTSRVDAVDVLAVRDAAAAAIAEIRAGGGPQLLECKTQRWKMHASRQVPLADPRDPEVLAKAAEHDPVAHLGERLIEAGEIDVAGIEQLERDVAAEIQATIEFAEKSPLPDPETALEDVFA